MEVRNMRNFSLLKRRGLVNHSVYITGTWYKYRKGYRYKKLLIFSFPIHMKSPKPHARFWESLVNGAPVRLTWAE